MRIIIFKIRLCAFLDDLVCIEALKLPITGLVSQFCLECLEAGRMQRSTYDHGCYSAEIATAQSIPTEIKHTNIIKIKRAVYM